MSVTARTVYYVTLDDHSEHGPFHNKGVADAFEKRGNERLINMAAYRKAVESTYGGFDEKKA